MAEEKQSLHPIRLQSAREISEANEWLFNQTREGKLDPKIVDGLNTTLKNSVYLNVKLRMDFLKIFVQSRMKKIDLPEGLLPEGLRTE